MSSEEVFEASRAWWSDFSRTERGREYSDRRHAGPEGAVLGVAANFFGGGITPKFVPSFAWGGAGGLTEHRIQDAVETAGIVMGRRNVEITSAMKKVLQEVFKLTEFERSSAPVSR